MEKFCFNGFLLVLTLPKTNLAPEKWWETSFLLGRPIFSGYMFVSGRLIQLTKKPSSLIHPASIQGPRLADFSCGFGVHRYL